MAININTLITGSMALGSSGSGSSGHAETWVKFSENDTWHEYDIKGALDISALIAAGLMPEGSGEMGPPEWTTQPYAVEIGTDVTSIGDWAFEDCSGLTSVTIGNSVTNIGYDAFYNCSSLTSVTIPGDVKSIGAWAFSCCSGLKSVTIGNDVTSIEYDAFDGCSGLTSMTFLGKTLEQVQQMDNYPWGISDTSIITVA